MLCCCDGLQNRTRKRMSPDVVFVLSWKSCDGPQLDLHLCAVLCGHNLTLLLGSARLCLRCLSARFLSVVSGHWMKALPDVLQVHGDTNLTVVMVLVLLLLEVLLLRRRLCIPLPIPLLLHGLRGQCLRIVGPLHNPQTAISALRQQQVVLSRYWREEVLTQINSAVPHRFNMRKVYSYERGQPTNPRLS
jgi:hypothetical protein